MRCRRLKTWADEFGTQHRDLVWFGSYGLNTDGTAKFYSEDKHDNYASAQEGVADSLTQRLSVLKYELWYSVNYGLPLVDKLKSKVSLDSFVASTVSSHPDVTSIAEFTSSIKNKKYACDMRIVTEYGVIVLSI